VRVVLPTVRWGEGERRALLIHGLTSSARVWWRVATELAERGWSVTAPDLRGHGHAPPAAHYGLADLAGDLLGLEGPWEVVVGHSIGGSVALVAGQQTGWANRLVLVDPLLVIGTDDRPEFEHELLDELGATESRLQHDHPDWHPDDVFWKLWSARQVSPFVVSRVLADNEPFDVRAMLAEVAVPTTVLVSDPRLGGLVDVEDTREHTRENPRIRIEPLNGVGHSVFRERPQDVVAAIVG
jgi:pimeloyl-ACP methyl ester carboxylesterase